MGWFFISPPAPLLWISFLVGLIALAVAIMALLPIFYGKPKLEISLRVLDLTEKRYLQCYIFNSPVDNRLLKLLGVRRSIAADVFTLFSIEDARTRRMIVKDVIPEIKDAQGTIAHCVSIPGSTTPADFVLVSTSNDGNTIIIGDSSNTVLTVGEYYADIFVKAGEIEVEHRRKFFVGQARQALYWEQPKS